MGSSIHIHRVQYAVVEARYGTANSERFVIAYYREKSLRDFIATRRIIASGFSSENEAVERRDAFDTHQGRLRRWLRPLEAGLNTVAGHLVAFSPAKGSEAVLKRLNSLRGGHLLLRHQKALSS